MKIAIASGKGGTGKTFVSTNLFWAAQQEGKTVTLVDCDAEEPNDSEFISGNILSNETVIQKLPVIDEVACTFCGKCFDYCNYNAIVYLPDNHFIRVVEDLCHDCGACSTACKFGAISERDKTIGAVKHLQINGNADFFECRTVVGVYSPVPVIKNAIKQTNADALIILDSPPGISCPFIATVDKADYVVLVTEPTPFGLNDLKLSAETLMGLQKPFGVVVNRAGLGNREVYIWMEMNNIPLLMEIPFDKEIARIYSEGLLLVETNSGYRKMFLKLIHTIENQLNDE